MSLRSGSPLVVAIAVQSVALALLLALVSIPLAGRLPVTPHRRCTQGMVVLCLAPVLSLACPLWRTSKPLARPHFATSLLELGPCGIKSSPEPSPGRPTNRWRWTARTASPLFGGQEPKFSAEVCSVTSEARISLEWAIPRFSALAVLQPAKQPPCSFPLSATSRVPLWLSFCLSGGSFFGRPRWFPTAANLYQLELADNVWFGMVWSGMAVLLYECI